MHEDESESLDTSYGLKYKDSNSKNKNKNKINENYNNKRLIPNQCVDASTQTNDENVDICNGECVDMFINGDNREYEYDNSNNNNNSNNNSGNKDKDKNNVDNNVDNNNFSNKNKNKNTCLYCMLRNICTDNPKSKHYLQTPLAISM